MFEKGIQHETDFESVLASILNGFSRAKEREKLAKTWEGCIIFDFRGLQDKVSFWTSFGRFWGRVWDGFWTIWADFWPFFSLSSGAWIWHVFLNASRSPSEAKSPLLLFLSLFRFGPKFACQLASFPHSYFCSFSRRFSAISQGVWRVSWTISTSYFEPARM